MNQRLKILISELKKRKKVFSQAEFAEIVGISRTQFSEIVTGKRKLSDKAIHKIVAAFPEINEDWLRNGDGEMLKTVSASAENHSISIAGEDIRENRINVNADDTIAMLVAEVAAQRKLTEKVLEQNSDLIAILAGKK
jgi:plasmid maintenance system antidote protein VapI